MAKIHFYKRELGLDDDAYRLMLRNIGGVDSAKDLDSAGATKVISHLMSVIGQRLLDNPTKGRPTNVAERGELAKIEALLSEGGKPWAYADAIAKRIYGVERVQFCDGKQLGGIIAALSRDASRHGRRTR